MGQGNSRAAQEVIETAQASIRKQAARPQHPRPRAPPSSFSHSEPLKAALQSDGVDPELLARLQKMGQVRVPTHGAHLQPGNQMLHIMRKRSEADEEALTPHRNKLPVEAIAGLLTARKATTTKAELEALCQRYHIDQGLLESLATQYSTPTPDATPFKRSEDGELFLSEWKDPPVVR